MINWKVANKYLPWYEKRIFSEDPLIADLFKLLVVGAIVFGIALGLTSVYGIEITKSFNLRKPIENQLTELDSLLNRIVKGLQGEMMLGDLKMKSVTLQEQTAPPTPASDKAIIYLDSSDGSLKVKFDDGDIITLGAY